MKKIKVMGVGSPIMDVLASVDDAFVAGIAGDKGGMVLVDSAEMQELVGKLDGQLHQAPGGSAANTTFALARLGVCTSLLGKLGNDEVANRYRCAFVEAGGSETHFKVGDVPNGQCLSLVTPDSERTMRTDLGAAMTLSTAEISVEDFADVVHLHVEGYLLFNRELIVHVLKCAKEAGCRVSLDLASFEVINASKDILADLLEEYVDIVFANEEEAEAFTGLTDQYEEMVKQLGELCDIAVVKVGAEGSYIRKGEATVKVAPIVVDELVDTTGAGDYWAAGFLYGLTNYYELPDCGRFGSVLGAEVVSVMGAELSEEAWTRVAAVLK